MKCGSGKGGGELTVMWWALGRIGETNVKVNRKSERKANRKRTEKQIESEQKANGKQTGNLKAKAKRG